jgi:hypothetical protein
LLTDPAGVLNSVICLSQFAGGFDGDTMRAFQYLKEKVSSFQSSQRQSQQNHQQRLAGKS